MPSEAGTIRREPIEPVNGKGKAAKRRPRRRFINWRTFDPSKVEGDQTLLEEELTYKDHQEELLKRKGDCVLIKGRRIIGIFADRREAIEKAVDLFGGQPVLVKQIVLKEPIHTLEDGIV
jgi:hypothetical protein